MPVRIRFPDQADSACPRTIRVEPCDGSRNILDLGATTFAKPFGIILLYGLIQHFLRLGEDVHVLIPNDDVARYLSRMDFHRPFADDVRVSFEPNLGSLSFNRWSRSGQLLEMRIVDVTSVEEVEAVEAELWGIISGHAPQYVPLSDQIRAAVVELLDNVRRHSKTARVTVIAQSFFDSVRIGVGDVGIGVRKSLEPRYDLKGMSDAQVLRFATEAGITGSAFGGGTGLTTIVDTVHNYGGAVHLASGQGTYSVTREGEYRQVTGLIVPGTIVEVVFERPSGFPLEPGTSEA